MSDATTATVVAPISPSIAEDPEEEAANRAKSVFRDFEDHQFYYSNVQLDDEDGLAVVTLDSEEGQARLSDRMEQTAEARETNLQKLMDAVGEASTLSEAARSDDLFNAAHRLGMYPHPEVGYLFDGSNWKFGSPVLNEGHLDDLIKCSEDATMYLVDLKLRC